MINLKFYPLASPRPADFIKLVVAFAIQGG